MISAGYIELIKLLDYRKIRPLDLYIKFQINQQENISSYAKVVSDLILNLMDELCLTVVDKRQTHFV